MEMRKNKANPLQRDDKKSLIEDNLWEPPLFANSPWVTAILVDRPPLMPPPPSPDHVVGLALLA